MILIKLLSKAPLNFLYILSDILFFFAYRIVKYRREVVLTNLKRSFPGKGEEEIKKIAKGFYRNLSDVIVESMKSISISKDEILKRVQFKNYDGFQEYIKQGKSMVVLTIHQCNWEWILLAGSVKFNPVDGVYQPLTNKKFDKLMFDTRSKFGGEPIPIKKVLKEFVKRPKEGPKILAMVADQIPPREARKYWTKFLNQETAFFIGSEYLPKLAGLPVFFSGMRRIKRGYYEVTITKLSEPPYEKDKIQIIDKFVKEAENLISGSPSNWLWSHKRWKYRKSDEDLKSIEQ